MWVDIIFALFQIADSDGVEIEDGIFMYEYQGDSSVVHFKVGLGS